MEVKIRNLVIFCSQVNNYKEEQENEEKEELKSIFDPFYQAFSTHEIIITCTADFTDKKTRHEYFFRFQIKSTQYKV
jgi:hypothetical protein